MQQSTIPTPASTAASFASFLTKLTITEVPEQPASGPGDELFSPECKPAPAWNDDDLADDVATLSYEKALRTHSRYSARESAVLPSISPPVSSQVVPQAHPVRPATAPPAAANSPVASAGVTHFERNLKDASITIRMSQAECEQLRHRAAEAGLTVSAYLRSCTFEVESLRGLVKETMTQLRSAQSAAETGKSEPKPSSRLEGLTSRFARLMPFRHETVRA